jgi:hypothetical protein
MPPVLEPQRGTFLAHLPRTEAQMNEKKLDGETERSHKVREVELGSYFDRDQPSWLPGSDRHLGGDHGRRLGKPKVAGVLADRAQPDDGGKDRQAGDGQQATTAPAPGNDPERNTM